MLINLRDALMAGKRLPYDAEVEYLRVDAVGPYIVIDGVTYCNAVGTYYAFTISSGGVVTHDLIPVRLGNTGYMYDRITNKRFGNAGTGDFVLGPDVVPVEYIESHGTEYIDIPVSGTPDEYFGIKGLVKITNTSQKTKAVWDTETNRQFGSSGYDISGASYVFGSWIGAKNANGGWLVSPRVLYPFEVSTLGRTLNGVFNPLSRNITSAFSTLRLFGKYGTTEYSGNASLAFGALTITNGLGIERKPFPVRVGSSSTWEGAMMDVLTRRIYRNAGTGAFTYGNDLRYPIPAE